MKTKDWLRMYFELIHHNKSALDPYNKFYYRAMAKAGDDPLAYPLTAKTRFWSAPDDYEGVTEYGIETSLLYAEDWEIEEFVRSLEVHNTSPYDCSGKLCTSWITWKRTPVGVAIVHRKTLDV